MGIDRGHFTGGYSLVEIGYRRWWYRPDPAGPLAYHARDGRRAVLAEPFETDGATVPRVFWSVPGFDPLDWPRAALLHDWLWEIRRPDSPRVEFLASNRLLEEALVALGWPGWHAGLIRRVIDRFGWRYWTGAAPLW